MDEIITIVLINRKISFAPAILRELMEGIWDQWSKVFMLPDFPCYPSPEVNSGQALKGAGEIQILKIWRK